MANDYYSPPDKPKDGDIAYVKDVNDLNDAADAGFSKVQTAVGEVTEELLVQVANAKKWSVGPGDPPDEQQEVEPGLYASKKYALDAETSETNAFNSASSAGVSEGNANTSATTALQAASNASSSESNSAASASASATSASEALVSANNASTSEAGAGSSASLANGFAGEASDSAIQSSNSALNAAGSETNAGNSENAAETAANLAGISETNCQSLSDQCDANALTCAVDALTATTGATTATEQADRAQTLADGMPQSFVEGITGTGVSNTDPTNPTISITPTTIGLGSVNNTSDTAKPISTATQSALNLKANLASPALSGNPTAPTQTSSNRSTRIATTDFCRDAIAAYGSSYTGVTALKSSRTTTGTWTISGLTTYKPLMLVYGETTTSGSGFRYRITSGGRGGTTSSSSHVFCLDADSSGNDGSGSSAVVIPTSTSVVVSLVACDGTVYAYQ